MSAWYAVHTHPQSEDKAVRNLINQGFEVYLPKFLKRRRHARKTELIKAPLFPRYLFVKIDINLHRWPSINSTHGVQYLVCAGSNPSAIQSEIIEEFQRHENKNGIIIIDPRERYKKGDPVRLLDGPFADVIGMFDSATDDQRVMILLDLMGRRVRVKLKPEFVEAAA